MSRRVVHGPLGKVDQYLHATFLVHSVEISPEPRNARPRMQMCTGRNVRLTRPVSTTRTDDGQSGQWLFRNGFQADEP
jgi:hypothetical protein